MEVADGVDDLGGGFADLVGGANGVAFVHTPAGEEDGHGVLVVIAPEAFAAAAPAIIRGAAEFTAPHDECVLEHAALLEIF